MFASEFSESVSWLRFGKLLSLFVCQILPALVVECCLYAFQSRRNSVDLFVCWTAERFSEAAAAECLYQVSCFIKHLKQTICVRRPNSFDMHSRCGRFPPTWEFSGWSFVALVGSVVDLRLICCALLIDFIYSHQRSSRLIGCLATILSFGSCKWHAVCEPEVYFEASSKVMPSFTRVFAASFLVLTASASRASSFASAQSFAFEHCWQNSEF